MAINKNFVVKNGFEVNTNLLIADATTDRVGIGTTIPQYSLDVSGGIGVTNFYVSGIGTFKDKFYVGSGGTVLSALGIGGSVGVGTALPEYLLDVRSPVSTGQTALYVKGDLRVTGDLFVDDIVLDVATVSNLSVSGQTNTNHLNATGITTTPTLNVPDQLNAPVGIITTLRGTNLYYSGIGSIATLNNINATGITTSQNLNVTGVTTTANIYSSGIVTATRFIGSGQVGVATTGGVLGYGVSFFHFYGAGVSTTYYNSNAGIATIFFQGGGGGASIAVTSVAPSGPTIGNLWFNINDGRTYIYYDEVSLGVGSDAYWIDAAPFNVGIITSLSNISFTNGSSVSPSWYFDNSSNTGVFSPSAGQLTFVSLGSSVLNVNPSGINVTGIATATSFRGNGINITGVVTATSFSGDGSNLTNLPAGLGTALSSDQNSPLNKIYYTNQVLSVGSTITVDPPSSAIVAYTQYAEIAVEGDADLIVADGDEFVPNILGIGTTGTLPALGGSGGRVRADNFSNKAGTGAPTFNAGLNIAGVMTATSAVVGSAVTINSTGINVSGIVTASGFVDDGTNLLSEINTKASTGKAIAMAMVFG